MTRGRWHKYRPRRTFHTTCGGSLGYLLGTLPAGVERVFLCGELPFAGVESVRRWASTDLPTGVVPDERGHYVHGSAPVLRYRVHGQPLEVLTARQWWGSDDVRPRDSDTAWRVLSGMVQTRRFRGAQLLSTPASTGRDLFLRSLGSREFPVLSDEMQELIRSTSGQGRIEVLDGPAEMPALVEYDGRMMYAGCCRELGHGTPTRDTVDEYAGHTRGRYRVRFVVPADWQHVGLLGVHDDGGGWWWPSEPGYTGETWCDGTELGIALDAGWRCRILERLLFPEHRGRPLDGWATGLLDALDAVPADERLRPMLRHAVRAMILHTIGAFHGRGQPVSRHAADASVIPSSAADVTFDRDSGLYSWTENRGQVWPELSHPEWSSAVWGRARARLLKAPIGDGSFSGAIGIPRPLLIGFRTDAIYMTTDPGWFDDGRVGRFTHRRTIRGPHRRPTSNVELLTLRNGSDDPFSSELTEPTFTA